MIKRILIIGCFILWMLSLFTVISAERYLNLTSVMPNHRYPSIKLFSKKSVDVDVDWYVFDVNESESKEFKTLADGKVYDLSDDSSINDKYGYEDSFSVHIVHYEPLNENSSSDGCRVIIDSIDDLHGNVISVNDTIEITKGHGLPQVYNYVYKFILCENYAPNDAPITTRFIKYFPSFSKISERYLICAGVILMISVYLFISAADKTKRWFWYIIWTALSVPVTLSIIGICINRMNEFI